MEERTMEFNMNLSEKEATTLYYALIKMDVQTEEEATIVTAMIDDLRAFITENWDLEKTEDVPYTYVERPRFSLSNKDIEEDAQPEYTKEDIKPSAIDVLETHAVGAEGIPLRNLIQHMECSNSFDAEQKKRISFSIPVDERCRGVINVFSDLEQSSIYTSGNDVLRRAASSMKKAWEKMD